MLKIKPTNPFNNFINNNFHALTNPNYRYFWLGQCISLIGTWTQSIGQSWLVFTLTNSPLLLGVLGAMQFLPVTFFTLFAGVLIDKYPKKTILIITQSVSMLLALTLAVLVFTHTVKYEYILVLAVLLGITNSIDMPARQAFMMEIAGREDLMNAIALNSLTFNLAKILGPSLGAVLMATLGAGWCFLINGLSFVAVIYGLFLIKVNSYVREKKINNIVGEIVDGLKYIVNKKSLIQPILLLLVIGIFAFNYNVILPVFVKNILHMEAGAFGILMASLGIGSVFGALTVSGKGKSGPRLKVMVISAVIVGSMLFLNGFVSQYIISMIILAIIGVFSIYFSANANTMLQVNSNDEYRGRVMSVYSLVFAGATPIGSLYTGITIDSIGVADTLKLTGGIIIFSIITISIIFIKKSRKTKNEE